MTVKSTDNSAANTAREPKRALGRGLSALIPAATRPPAPVSPTIPQEESSPRNGLLQIPLLNIALNPYQPRENIQPDTLAELTESIRMHGVLQPIVVRPKGKNTFELVAGERRFRAATSAGLKEIPAVVKEIDNRTSLAIALIENIQRQQLNPVESARAYRRLMDEFGLNQTELGLEVGKSQPAIANSLRLLTLPEVILDSLTNGVITEGHAKVLLSVEGNDAKIELWNVVTKGSLSVRETERRAAARKFAIPRGIKSKSIENAKPDIEIDRLEEQLSLKLGTKVALRFTTSNKGSIDIQFYDLDQLDGLIEALANLKK